MNARASTTAVLYLGVAALILGCPEPTHEISGAVFGAGTVTISLTGKSTASATTDLSGNYKFTGLANGDYTLAPSKLGYTFSPPTLAVTVKDADVVGQNFTANATNNTFSISGAVSGATKAGVTLSLTGAAQTSTVTDANGEYTLGGLGNGTYTLTPSKAGYTFSPASLIVTVSGASVTAQNFTASAVSGGHTISGSVSGAATAGVTVSLIGEATRSVSTDAGGTFSFSGVENGTYTLMPSKTGYTFAPPSRTLTVNDADVTGLTFTAISTNIGHSISGAVTGATTSGVTLSLTGAATDTALTDTGGNYSFNGLPDGNYVVTPSKAGYTFSPASRTVTLSGADVGGKNFVATAVTIGHSISGTVTGATTVTIALSGASTTSTTTDPSGNFIFPGLGDGSYTLTPSKAGYVFTPASRSATVNGADVPGQNFAAAAVSCTNPGSGACQDYGKLYCGFGCCPPASPYACQSTNTCYATEAAAAAACGSSCVDCVTAASYCPPATSQWCNTAGWLSCGGSGCCAPSYPYLCQSTCYATAAQAETACGGPTCIACAPACVYAQTGTCSNGQRFCTSLGVGLAFCCPSSYPYGCAATQYCYSTAADAIAHCPGQCTYCH